MHRISPFYANIFYYFRQRHTAIFVPQLIHPPELGGRDAGVLLELLAERKTVRVPQLEGQLLQRQIAAQQQRLGAVDPDANGVLPHGDSGGSPELLPQGFIAQIHLGGNLLPGDPPGVALHETAGQPDAVVLLPGAGAAGSDGTQKLLGFKIQTGQGLSLGALHGGQEVPGGGKNLFQGILLTVHHRAVRHQAHGQEIVIALRTDADEKLQPLSVRLYDGGMLYARKPLYERAPRKLHARVAAVEIFPLPVQEDQAAVIFKSNVPVAPPIVRLVEKAAGKVPGSLVGAYGSVRYICLILRHTPSCPVPRPPEIQNARAS